MYNKLFNVVITAIAILILSGCVGSNTGQSILASNAKTQLNSSNNTLVAKRSGDVAPILDVGLSNGYVYENHKPLFSKPLSPNPNYRINTIGSDGTNVYVLSGRDVFVSQIGATSWQKITPGVTGGALSMTVMNTTGSTNVFAYNSDGVLYYAKVSGVWGHDNSFKVFGKTNITNDSNSIMTSVDSDIYFTVSGGTEVLTGEINYPSLFVFKESYFEINNYITAMSPIIFNGTNYSARGVMVGTELGNLYPLYYSYINPLAGINAMSNNVNENSNKIMSIVIDCDSQNCYGLFTQNNYLYAGADAIIAELPNDDTINSMIESDHILYIGANDGFVYSDDTINFSGLEKFIESSPDGSAITALSIVGNYIYVGTASGGAFFASLSNPSTGWQSVAVAPSTPDFSSINSLTRNSDGLYVGTQGGNVWQVNESKISWSQVASQLKYPIDAVYATESINESSANYPYNNLYILSGGSMYMYNSANNTWKQMSNNEFSYTNIDNAAISMYGVIYIHSLDNVYVDASNSWIRTLSGIVSSSSVKFTTMYSSDVNCPDKYFTCVYMAGTDHNIYAGVYVGQVNGFYINLGQPSKYPIISLATIDGMLFAIDNTGQVFMKNYKQSGDWSMISGTSGIVDGDKITVAATKTESDSIDQIVLGSIKGNVYSFIGGAENWGVVESHPGTSVSAINLY